MTKNQKNIIEQAIADFKAELKMLIKQKLDEINHYISGCDSPFSYAQIRGVQGLLNDIIEELNIDASGKIDVPDINVGNIEAETHKT